MLIEIWIRIESENVSFSLFLIQLWLNLESHVNFSESALIERQQIVSFDQMNLQVATFAIVVDSKMKFSYDNAIFRRIDNKRTCLTRIQVELESSKRTEKSQGSIESSTFQVQVHSLTSEAPHTHSMQQLRFSAEAAKVDV